MSRQTGRHTCARPDALAVREDPPSPALRPGPIHRMGRAARCRAHALTGSVSAWRNAQDECRPTFARTLFPRPAQAGKGCSARASDHEDVRTSRWHGRVDKRTHLPDLPQTFERRTPPPRQLVGPRGKAKERIYSTFLSPTRPAACSPAKYRLSFCVHRSPRRTRA